MLIPLFLILKSRTIPIKLPCHNKRKSSTSQQLDSNANKEVIVYRREDHKENLRALYRQTE